MQVQSKISFEDTSVAFSYKTTAELKKANLIFSLVNHPWISAMATGMVKFAFGVGLPIGGIVKKTAFSHFCGGETIQETEKVMARLAKFKVGTILDYSVEGEKTESGFEQTTAEILKTLDEARLSGNIPFSVFKVTGLASFELLEKLNRKEALTEEEAKAFDRVRGRVNKICRKAHELKVPVLIDAEETWIQDPIDQLAYEMMAQYNKEKAIVFNTFQLYRTDTLGNLKTAVNEGRKSGYQVGAKLVRGAYMEKERARAEKLGYASPIQPNKEASDRDFNDALLFSVTNISQMAVMCGSHNDVSNLYLAHLLDANGISHNDPRIWFAQLFGMSDNISFNLANAGYNVAKYVPYGPVKAVMPYLLRRAAENTSVAGQSSRELTLIRKELNRRKGL
jgi:proline dehydrogenase